MSETDKLEARIDALERAIYKLNAKVGHLVNITDTQASRIKELKKRKKNKL